jgi:hypothetical protein
MNPPEPTPNKPIYFNEAQIEAMYTAAHTEVIVAGRRFGKSHGIIGPRTLRNVQVMPRSSGAFVGDSYQKLLTQTLPGTFASLESLGFKRNLHYYIGTKPPKSARFQTPYINPASYDHVIAWYNGSIQYLISQDRTGTSNSMTLDYLIMDEAKDLSFDKLKSETFPANGGFKGYFGHCPWHHGLLIVSDMPTSKKGSWFLNYKEKMDPELIETIQGLVHEQWRLKSRLQEEDSLRVKYQLNSVNKTLRELRSIAVYYREWSSIENMLILGEKYIHQMKRDLPPMVFMTSILSKRIMKLKDGFYPGLKETVHYYTAYNNSYLDSLNYDLERARDQDCRQDADVDFNRPICIALDFNANISWLVCGQADGLKMRTLKSFYVKYERKIRELCQDFARYYRFHNLKKVNFYYDNTALTSNYAVNDEDFAWVIVDELNKLGWQVDRQHIGNPLKHHEKYIMIDQALKGQQHLFPLFNKHNNEALLLAMEQTGVKVGPLGFQKEKGGEKLAENEEDKLEYRTDGTDAWDTLFIGMNRFPVADYGSGFSTMLI